MNLNFLRHFLLDSSFRNVQLLASRRFRRWFPALCHRIENPYYKLTTQDGFARYNRIHLILRTTDAVMNVNCGRQLDEIGIHTKRDVTLIGAGSVAKSVKEFQNIHGKDSILVTIVADRLTSEGRDIYKELFSASYVEFVESKPGNANTFRTQIEIAIGDTNNTLIAVYEDDYLTDKKAFCIMFDLFNSVPRLAGFTPHNHPGMLKNAHLTRLYYLNDHFYKLINTTTCTFIAGADLIKKYRSKFMLYDGFEGHSINAVWKRELCLAPCGWTLAEHLHRCDLSPVQALVSR